MPDYKVIVAHPGKQHSFRVATALKNEGMLFRYLTTVYYKQGWNLTHITEIFLKGDNQNRAQKRHCDALEDFEVIQYGEFLSLLQLLFNRIDKKRNASNGLAAYVSRKFQIKVAKYAIKNNVDAVISYDTNSTVMFEYLKKNAPQIVRIIDDAHPNRNYLYKVYQEKIESAGEFKKTYEACGYLLDKDVASKFGYESRLAHYHIVASTFSENAVLFNGFKPEQVYKVPYGVNKQAFAPGKKNYQKLQVLFVGEVNQRKGIRQILESAKTLSDSDIEFHIVGTGREYHSELYTEYENYVKFYGRVPFDLLQKLFAESSIFIFPSMGEGFGLVVLEAMSAGLPAIVSTNCCGGDVVRDGYNGFVIDAGDDNALTDKILWFDEHKDLIPRMSENARTTALEFTWERYENGICNAVRDMIEKGPYEKPENE